MAVAQPKPKSTPKANATTTKGKSQMHRRSRTGLFKLIILPVTFH
jgi:hypothetical protein